MDILVINYKTVLSIIAATAMMANTFFMMLFFIKFIFQFEFRNFFGELKVHI